MRGRSYVYIYREWNFPTKIGLVIFGNETTIYTIFTLYAIDGFFCDKKSLLIIPFLVRIITT